MCTALVAGVVIQLVTPGGVQSPDDPGLAPRRPRALSAALIPDYPAILQAPIFAPGRAPGETTTAEATGAAAAVQVLGLAASGRIATAIVRGPDGATHVLQPGQALLGWRLVAVLPTAAVFMGPAGRTTVPVGAKPAAPTAAAQPNAAAPGAPSTNPPPSEL